MGRSERQTVLLTTHSMEEAEALCSRIGLIVNGELRCLGNTLHIKTRFGTGYTLELQGWTSGDPEEEIKNRIPGATLTEVTCAKRVFQLPPLSGTTAGTRSLGDIFSIAQNGRKAACLKILAFVSLHLS